MRDVRVRAPPPGRYRGATEPKREDGRGGPGPEQRPGWRAGGQRATAVSAGARLGAPWHFSLSEACLPPELPVMSRRRAAVPCGGGPATLPSRHGGPAARRGAAGDLRPPASVSGSSRAAPCRDGRAFCSTPGTSLGAGGGRRGTRACRAVGAGRRGGPGRLARGVGAAASRTQPRRWLPAVEVARVRGPDRSCGLRERAVLPAHPLAPTHAPPVAPCPAPPQRVPEGADLLGCPPLPEDTSLRPTTERRPWVSVQRTRVHPTPTVGPPSLWLPTSTGSGRSQVV